MISIRFGITFSHTHLNYLKIPIDDALDFALEMGFSHLRLGSYWQAIEKSKGLYNFSVLEDLLNRCEKTKQKVIMNVGVKSPRWPEFYWPGYLKEKDFNNLEAKKRTLLFIEKLVKTLKNFSCITHWQVENEPLDPSGQKNLAVPIDFLKEEVELVRKLDSRPIILTLWANDLESRQLFPKVSSISDVIGLDIYYKQFMKSDKGKSVYEGPRTNNNYLQKIIKTSPKEMIITELQAEPWEKDEKEYLSKNPESISPKLLESNLKKALSLGVKEILLWGFEYWYYQKSQGDHRYLKIIKEYL
ncbi:MAG: endo-1,4-beta-xylanase [Patescibacteria group bacterium]|nr:hypothetical protein [Patescibacteria group bacterium]MBU4381334.1 hypothetical protein [Patescibacteria group bacterium]